jgi:dual specificity MAP kinase phosphatase
MDWITPQIAIGNFLDAQQVSDEVDSILCLEEECCDEGRTDIDVLAIPLIDGKGNVRRQIEEAVNYVQDMVAAGERILMHCHAGRSRSVSIVARYLMATEGLRSGAALAKIGSKRKIYLSPGIVELFTACGQK